MGMIRLPRSLATGQRLHPVNMSVTLNMTPVHTAEMELYPDEQVSPRELIEVYTPQGSAGVFRVTAVDRITGDVTRVTLQHALCTLNDAILRSPEDEEDRETSARALLAEIFAAQSEPLWALGRLDIPDDRLITWRNSDSGLMDALLSMMEEFDGYMLTFDQSQSPWLVNVVSLTDEDACECRLNRNMTSLSVSLDTADMCTRLYVPGRDEPLDADTIPRWGVIARVLEADEDLGEEMLLEEGQRFLDAHKDPQLTVVIDALDLHRATGEPFDTFHTGRICRVALPDEGATIRQRVVSVNWTDVYGEPERAMVTLSHQAPDAAAQLAGLVVDTTILRKTVTKAATDGEKRYEEFHMNLETVERDLKQQQTATNNRVDVLSNRIDQAEDNIDTTTGNLKLLDGVALKSQSVASGSVRVIPSYGTITYMTATGGTGSFTAVTGITVTGNDTATISYLGK